MTKILTDSKTETWINDDMMFYEDTDIYCTIVDVDGEDIKIPLGIYFEITDMLDATGDEEYKKYRYNINAEIMVCNPDILYLEDDGCSTPNIDRDNRLEIVYDCASNMGGVYIGDFLYTGVKNDVNGVMKNTLEELNGRYYETKEGGILFEGTEEINLCISLMLKRVPALGIMIGFILDKTTNYYTQKTGWDILQKQLDKNYDRTKIESKD